MEDASPVAKEDTFSGSLPAESSSAHVSGQKTASVSGVSDAALDDFFFARKVSPPKPETRPSTASPPLAAPSAGGWYAYLGATTGYVRIACGVCLLGVAALLLCIAAAAGLSVYRGYDFTEGVVGQFMSSRVTPIVTRLVRHPLLLAISSSAKLVAAVAAAAFTAGALAAAERSRVGGFRGCCRGVSECLSCCLLALRSPLLLLRALYVSCSRCGSCTPWDGSGRGGRRGSAAAAACVGSSARPTGAAGYEAVPSSAAGRLREGAGGLQQADADNGRRAVYAAAAVPEEEAEVYYRGRAGETRGRKVPMDVAQQRLRQSLQILPWWSAPLLRLKAVIRTFFNIVAAKLRGPDAAEEASAFHSARAAGRAATAGGAEGTAGGGPAASTPGPAAAAAAAKLGAAATGEPPTAAAGWSSATAGGATAADLGVTGRRGAAETAGGLIETRKGTHGGGGGGEADKRKERESRPVTLDKLEERSRDASPRRRRSRETAAAGHFWDSTGAGAGAASAAAKHPVQHGKQQERNISAAETGRAAEGLSLGEEGKGRKSRAYPPVVEEGHGSSRPRAGASTAAGRRGDSESSAGSLLTESEVEEWLVLQEADGRRK